MAGKRSKGRGKPAGPNLGKRIRKWILGTLLTIFGLVFVLPVTFVLIFRVVPPPFTPLMVIRLIEGEGIERAWAPLDSVSSYVAPAVLAAEDSRFCQHAGVDWHEFRQALSDWLGEGRMRGASTVSMQTAKNVFLWPGRSLFRKGLEAYLTGMMEWFWPKSRIIEVYLNVAEWAPGVYGIEAAARGYLEKPMTDLSHADAAILMVALRGGFFDPVCNPAVVLVEANELLARLTQHGVIGGRTQELIIGVSPDRWPDAGDQCSGEDGPTR